MPTVISRCELLRRGSNYSGVGNWLDETANGHDAVITDAVFDTDHFIFDGAGDFMTTPDDAGLDFANGDSFTIMLRFRIDGNQATGDRLMAKKSGFSQGYSFVWGNTTTRLDFSIGDGGEVHVRTADAAVADDVIIVAAGVRDVVADDIDIFLDGVVASSPGPTADTTAATLATATDLFTGRKGYGATNYLHAHLFAEAIWREALSDADVATATDELNGIFAPDPIAATRRVISSPRYGITRMARR